MLKNGKGMAVTCEEGQALLRVAMNFALPERLGETTYSVVERSLATDEVKNLYRELRSVSPMLQRPERWILFGPGDNYNEMKGENGAIGHKMKNLDLEVRITLDEDAMSGAVWCLILAMHPASPICQSVGTISDIFWPLAEKLRKVKALKEAIGLDKAKPRRWATDDDVLSEEKVEEKK